MRNKRGLLRKKETASTLWLGQSLCFCRFGSLVLQKGAKQKQNGKKSKIECREFSEISHGAVGIVGGILAEGDQAGERRDQRTRAADVNAKKKRGII